MNDDLFKQLGAEMSLAEEEEFTRRLAAAYREHEASERLPGVERIAMLVRQRLESEATCGEERLPAPLGMPSLEHSEQPPEQ
jgi:hypothetical protein